MIKLIATIDLVRGIANDIDLPSVVAYKENKIKSGGFISDPDRFDELINEASELYITQLCSDFECKDFFPQFETKFRLMKRGNIKKENGVEYQHQIWKRLTGVNKSED